MPFLIFSSASSYAGNSTSFISLPRVHNKSKFPEFLKLPISPATAVDLTTKPFDFNTGLLPLHLSTSSAPASIAPNSYIWEPQIRKKSKCPDCTKYFACISSMKRHRETVCGKVRNINGKWKCKICTRRYESLGSLSRHYRFECGVEPRFLCCFCERKFTQQCSLKRHIKKKHLNITSNPTFDKCLSNNNAVSGSPR